jgi:hypothetical protein
MPTAGRPRESHEAGSTRLRSNKMHDIPLPMKPGKPGLLLRQVNMSKVVIPGLTRNPVLSWIPAGVYPVLDTGRE